MTPDSNTMKRSDVDHLFIHLFYSMPMFPKPGNLKKCGLQFPKFSIHFEEFWEMNSIYLNIAKFEKHCSMQSTHLSLTLALN